jgi:RimJ/RimL family protein N-acetyltransferase
MAREADPLERYPQRIALTDGTKVEVRAMTPDDGPRILAFASALPDEDLLFLRVDITEPAGVEEWIDNLRNGLSVSLLALEGEAVVGYASVHRNPARWTRRVGELRVNVGPRFRSKGLGRSLTSQIFDVARSLGLRKLTAQMTPDQAGARAAFKRLGFIPEALLADYVEDRRGRPHDLIVMTYDVDGLSDHVDDPLRL